MARPADTRDRHTQIIEAVLDIIADRGIAGLTMLAIAGKVGVTDAALYRHFPGKREIISEAIAHVGRTVRSRLERAGSPGEDPVEQLRLTLHFLFDHLQHHRGMPRILFSETVHQEDPGLREQVRGIVSDIINIFREILERAAGEGYLKSELDSGAAAQALFGLVQSTALLYSLSDFDRSGLVEPDRLFDVFISGLK